MTASTTQQQGSNGGTVALQEETFVARSLWSDAVRRFRKNHLAMFGLTILVILVAVAILADVLAPYPYDKANFSTCVRSRTHRISWAQMASAVTT